MYQTEKTLYQAMKKNLPRVHWQRVETGALSTGVPDVNGCWQGSEFWVELKIGVIQSVKLSPQQCAWHMRRASSGGVSWIFASDPSSRKLWMVSGNQSINLRNRVVDSSLSVHHYSQPYDWKAILEQFCLTDRLTV